MQNKLDVSLLMRTLSDILSDKYGAKIVLTAIPKPPEATGTQKEAATA